MTDYTPKSWVTGSKFAAAEATAMSQELEEQEVGDVARDAAIVALQASSVTPERFGAVGDGTTDDGAALEEMFNDYAVTNGGASICIPSGKVYASSTPFNIKDNTYVYGGGTIKCTAVNGTGGFILLKNAVHNVTWIGPTLDINGITNVNGFAIGDVPNSTDFVSDIYIVATVIGSRIDTALENTNNTLYSGGGKGITVQFRARNVYANIRAEDCDISASVEAAFSSTRYLENVVLDIQSKDAHRTHLFISGAKDSSVSSLDSGEYFHSLYPGVKIRLRAQGGQDAPITHPVTDVVGTNYDHAGVVTMNYASGVDVEVYAAVQERCTLVRGMASASRIRVTHALMDDLQDAWDSRPIDTLTAVGFFLADNVFECNVHAATHSGVLVRPHRSGADRTMTKTQLDVSVWCQGGVGAITQSDGTTDEFGASVVYRFQDMKASPTKEIVGKSSHNPSPQWSLAASGGRVAAERESWHDGTREVAVFDPAGWHFTRMHWDESPLIIGTGGANQRWLHYDATNQILRMAGSAPVNETAGPALAIQNFSAAEADGTTTPTALGKTLIITANTAPTTITNLTNGRTAQVVTIVFGDAFTTVAHNATIKLRGGANKLFTTGSTLTLISSGGVWYQIGSSDPNLAVTTIELGNASDTTVSRPSAGDIAIENNIVYRAGGTDVPVTDGGTGASTAAGARTNLGAEATANKNAVGGYAGLDGGGLIPSGLLPSYVDDVVEVANFAALPGTGETGKIYVTVDNNLQYRWTGSVYIALPVSDAELAALAGLVSAADKLPYFTGSAAAALADFTAFARTILDDADAATVRTTLGLGSVDNTADTAKPVSTAQQTALDLKAPLISPSFTTPALGTVASGDVSACTAVTTATASKIAQRDSDANLTADNFIVTATPTTTAAGTTTLAISDTQTQVFTGATTQTVKLPTTSVVAGQEYKIVNNSSAAVSVQSSNGNAIITLQGSKTLKVSARIDTPVASTDWDIVALTATTVTGAGTGVLRDTNGNIAADNFLAATTSTVTAAGTTPLDINSRQVQTFTGSTTQTVLLPTTSVTAGQTYTINNQSSGAVTVQSSGANTIATVAGGADGIFLAHKATPTAAADWKTVFNG